MRRVFPPMAASLWLCAAVNASAGQTPRNTLFPIDQDACFGKVFDAAHLQRHPDQRIAGIHVFRRPAPAPGPDQGTSQDGAKSAPLRNSAPIDVSALISFRDREGAVRNGLSCRPDDSGRLQCGVDCDTGRFMLERDGSRGLILRNAGFAPSGGCGELAGSAEIAVAPGKADALFRLPKLAPEVCRAQLRKAAPVSAEAPPLHRRLTPNETFCFGRDFDRAHLARHPQQKIASIRITRGEADLAADQGAWPSAMKITALVTLRDRIVKRTANYVCAPLDNSLECENALKDEKVISICRRFHLAGGTADELLLINRRDGLPIESDCDEVRIAEEENGSRDRITPSDDRIFRLSRMPAAACRPGR